MSKGSKRRIENFKRIQQNWDEILWPSKIKESNFEPLFKNEAEFNWFKEGIKWKCKRCGCIVENFKCGCETSPSPWEPV